MSFYPCSEEKIVSTAARPSLSRPRVNETQMILRMKPQEAKARPRRQAPLPACVGALGNRWSTMVANLSRIKKAGTTAGKNSAGERTTVQGNPAEPRGWTPRPLIRSCRLSGLPKSNLQVEQARSCPSARRQNRHQPFQVMDGLQGQYGPIAMVESGNPNPFPTPGWRPSVPAAVSGAFKECADQCGRL